MCNYKCQLIMCWDFELSAHYVGGISSCHLIMCVGSRGWIIVFGLDPVKASHLRVNL